MAVSAFFSAATPIVDVFVAMFAVVTEFDTAVQTYAFVPFAPGRVAETVVAVPAMQSRRDCTRNAHAAFAAKILMIVEETFSALVAYPFFVAEDAVRFAVIHTNIAVFVQRIHAHAASRAVRGFRMTSRADMPSFRRQTVLTEVFRAATALMAVYTVVPVIDTQTAILAERGVAFHLFMAFSAKMPFPAVYAIGRTQLPILEIAQHALVVVGIADGILKIRLAVFAHEIRFPLFALEVP